MQLTHVLATFLLTAGSVLAAPPACFMGALNTVDNPADVKGICQNKASDLQKNIYSMCPTGDQSAAFSALADTCKAQGVTVASPTPQASSSSSSNKTSSSSPSIVNSNGTTSNSKNNTGDATQITTGALSILVAGFVGAATFVL